MRPAAVGILGATSFVGRALLPLLSDAGCQISVFSRQPVAHNDAHIKWNLLPPVSPLAQAEHPINDWVCVAPIWVLADYLPWMKSMGARRVVALSSTSRYTKTASSDLTEQILAQRLLEGEQNFIAWAEANAVEWIILRPTLIYGLALDKNICEIARFIRRFSFFPVFGQAGGLRQPIHVQDLALACVAALYAPSANRAYNLSGGETLSYREMVKRIFNSLNRTPRLLSVPLPAFSLAVALLRLLPRYRKWSSAMAMRMNSDLVFDHTEAKQDLGFNPRPFVLTSKDLPQ